MLCLTGVRGWAIMGKGALVRDTLARENVGTLKGEKATIDD